MQVILRNARALKSGRLAERRPPGGHHPRWGGLCVIMLFGEYSHSSQVTSHLCVVGEPSQIVGSLVWTIVESYYCPPLMPYLESINSCSCPPLKTWHSTSVSFPFRTVAQRWKVVEASHCQLIIVVLGPMRTSKALDPTSLFLVTLKRLTAALPFLRI